MSVLQQARAFATRTVGEFPSSNYLRLRNLCTDPTLRWASWRRIIQLAVWKVGDGSSNFYDGSDDASLVVLTLGNCSFDGRFLENFPTLISSLPILTPTADEANKDEFDESDDPDDGSDNERIIQLAVWKVGDGSSNFYEGSDDAGLVVPTLGNCSFDGRFLENFPTLISSLPILTPIADEANKDEFDESDDPDDGSDNE
ncbi:hypothetical protein F2Q69_00059218 [Brassica cretica]|uniref:Uncharacterized protein n=1 Tax=Brassica cretica TaxID=69181 RepID=A0A8S9RMM6_BRACR|nr:hypothetical protein F2Q69_00059218 [Brassica cretica]